VSRKRDFRGGTGGKWRGRFELIGKKGGGEISPSNQGRRGVGKILRSERKKGGGPSHRTYNKGGRGRRARRFLGKARKRGGEQTGGKGEKGVFTCKW